MTKEDRLLEIEDYVAYLDALYYQTFDEVDRLLVKVRVLGFSQGATTACRWLSRGTASADQLILWAGSLPHDLIWETDAPLLRRLQPVLVVGDQDEFVTPELLQNQQKILDQHNVPYQLITFEGKHRLNTDILKQLANHI
jgi:predicted esterase